MKVAILCLLFICFNLSNFSLASSDSREQSRKIIEEMNQSLIAAAEDSSSYGEFLKYKKINSFLMKISSKYIDQFISNLGSCLNKFEDKECKGLNAMRLFKAMEVISVVTNEEYQLDGAEDKDKDLIYSPASLFGNITKSNYKKFGEVIEFEYVDQGLSSTFKVLMDSLKVKKITCTRKIIKFTECKFE
jgi:hypothetical protein